METLVTIRVSIVLPPQFETYMEPRERIVNKAHELFMRYGIRSVSMDEVANHLGMSKKTIYQFYTDKDELVSDVIDIEIKKSEQLCSMHKQQSDNAIHEVFMAVDMVLEILSSMNPMLLFDMEKYHPKAHEKHNAFKNKFLFKIIHDNIEWGKKEGLYRPEVNAVIMTRFRLASMMLIFNPEQFPLGKLSLADVVTETTDNFLYGLVTPKGLKLIQKYKQQRETQATTYKTITL
jgi:AcrR family transcriptional regulator